MTSSGGGGTTPLIRLSPSLPPVNPLRDVSSTSAEEAAKEGLIPKPNGEGGCDKNEANTECTKVFKPSALAREGREGGGGGEATLALTLTGVAEGDTEGAEEVGVATDERFLPLATKDLQCFKYSNISSFDQELHSLHLFSTEHKTFLQ